MYCRKAPRGEIGFDGQCTDYKLRHQQQKEIYICGVCDVVETTSTGKQETKVQYSFDLIQLYLVLSRVSCFLDSSTTTTKS